MEGATLTEEPAVDVKAWRIRFRAEAQSGETPILRMQLPQSVVAVCEPTDPREPPQAEGEEEPGAFRILWLPPGAASSAAEIESAWLSAFPAEGQASDRRIVRAGLRTIRVVWSADRAILYSAPDLLDDTLDAVIRFTVAEHETARLERQMMDTYSVIEKHAPLTHTAPRRRYREIKAEVNEVTEQVTRMTGVLLRLQAAIEQLDPALTAHSKRLYAELVLQAGVFDRLEMLEDPLDYATEHYERVNTRMIEARSSSSGIWAERAILVVLLAEFVATISLFFG